MKRISWALGMLFVCLVLAGISRHAAYAVLDTTPPTGTIFINNNRSATNTLNVTLTLTWYDGVGGSGVARMRFSDDGAHWTAWETLAATRAYTLPTGADGHKTVRVQYLDRASNRSAMYSDYIRLDTTLPTGTIIINGGASTTTSQLVSLGLTWSDGDGAQVSRMRFSDDGAHWTAWMPPAATYAYTLPAGLGYHTVRVQYLDGANNYSLVYNDYIKLVSGTGETNCADAIDNDMDGLIDCKDPDCAQSPDCGSIEGEGEFETDCDDGIDNDMDGKIDCKDSDCTFSPACGGAEGEQGETDCADGIDNDMDGKVDCRDSDCLGSPDC